MCWHCFCGAKTAITVAPAPVVLPAAATATTVAASASNGLNLAMPVLSTIVGWEEEPSISRFPQEIDRTGQMLPLLLAAFNKSYCERVLLAKMAASPVSEAFAAFATDTDDDQDERLQATAISVFESRHEIRQATNRLLTVAAEANECDASLWVYAALLQMSLIKKGLRDAPRASEVFHVGLFEAGEVESIKQTMHFVLRGVRMCYGSEDEALVGVSESRRPESHVCVLFRISVEGSKGAAVSTSTGVMLIDGTPLKVNEIAEPETAKFPSLLGRPDDGCEYVRVSADIDGEKLDRYLALCDKARR